MTFTDFYLKCKLYLTETLVSLHLKYESYLKRLDNTSYEKAMITSKAQCLN